jgi:polyphosphate kinase
MKFQVEGYPQLRDPPHEPVIHPRLRHLDAHDSADIFDEIRRGDILTTALTAPYCISCNVRPLIRRYWRSS